MSAAVDESDWALFAEMVPRLRERYLALKNRNIVALLQDESLTPLERFEGAEEFIKRERKVLRLCLTGHSRATMTMFMALMYRYQMLKREDLEQFSEALVMQIREFSAI